MPVPLWKQANTAAAATAVAGCEARKQNALELDHVFTASYAHAIVNGASKAPAKPPGPLQSLHSSPWRPPRPLFFPKIHFPHGWPLSSFSDHRHWRSAPLPPYTTHPMAPCLPRLSRCLPLPQPLSLPRPRPPLPGLSAARAVPRIAAGEEAYERTLRLSCSGTCCA